MFKKNKKQISKSNSNINWDEPIEIETRDTDSINSENPYKKSDNNQQLYTFYDYIKKEKPQRPIPPPQPQPRMNYTPVYTAYQPYPPVQPMYTSTIMPAVQPIQPMMYHSVPQIPVTNAVVAYSTPQNTSRQPPKKIVVDQDSDKEVHIVRKSNKPKQVIYIDDDRNDDDYEVYVKKPPKNTKKQIHYIEEPNPPKVYVKPAVVQQVPSVQPYVYSQPYVYPSAVAHPTTLSQPVVYTTPTYQTPRQ